MSVSVADDLLVSDAIEVGRGEGRATRVHRTAAEKRRIVEATLVPGAVDCPRGARERSQRQPGLLVALRAPQGDRLGGQPTANGSFAGDSDRRAGQRDVA